jgi:hypothetical protein
VTTVAVVLAMGGVAFGVFIDQGSTPPVPRYVHHSTTTSPPLRASSPTPPVLNRPEGLAVDSNGDLLIANEGTSQILRRLPDGTLQVVAGTGTAGYGGDGGPAVGAELNMPYGISVAPDGTIYVADTMNNRVRAISPSGIITTVAGDGRSGGDQPGVGPLGKRAVDTMLSHPYDVAVGPQGKLYIADSTGIQVVSSAGVLRALTLSGVTGLAPATSALPNAIAVDQLGNVYVAAFSPKMLIEFSPTGVVLHIWGVYVAPGGGLAIAPNGSILVADYGFTLDQVSNGELTRIASFSLNALPGITGTFRPSGVTVTPTGTIYIDTDGANGGTNTPALATVSQQGQMRVVDTGPNTVLNAG